MKYYAHYVQFIFFLFSIQYNKPRRSISCTFLLAYPALFFGELNVCFPHILFYRIQLSFFRVILYYVSNIKTFGIVCSRSQFLFHVPNFIIRNLNHLVKAIHKLIHKFSVLSLVQLPLGLQEKYKDFPLKFV